jgi:hypothetical protein
MKNDMDDNYVHELIDILIKNQREPQKGSLWWR